MGNTVTFISSREHQKLSPYFDSTLKRTELDIIQIFFVQFNSSFCVEFPIFSKLVNAFEPSVIWVYNDRERKIRSSKGNKEMEKLLGRISNGGLTFIRVLLRFHCIKL